MIGITPPVASLGDRIVQILPTIGLVILMLLYISFFNTFLFSSHTIDLKSWATQPSIVILGVLPSVGLYILVVVRGIQYNCKHNIE
jgi:hypothetical protein